MHAWPVQTYSGIRIQMLMLAGKMQKIFTADDPEPRICIYIYRERERCEDEYVQEVFVHIGCDMAIYNDEYLLIVLLGYTEADNLVSWLLLS